MAKRMHPQRIWGMPAIKPDPVAADADGEEKTTRSQSLRQKLSLSQPLLQKARMERAKSLAADPNYPTEKIIQALAEMLARHWYS